MHTNFNTFPTFQKNIDYREIEQKEAGSGSKSEKLNKFLLEKEEGKQDDKKGQKRYTLTDLARKKKKEATQEVDKKN